MVWDAFGGCAMEKAKPFEEYFDDARLGSEKLERMQLTRTLVHKLYPEVQERVSYAMPGFYPVGATKATQQLFLLIANDGWLGMYGTQGLEAGDLKDFEQYGVTVGKGSLRVPYDMPEDAFGRLLRFVIDFNLARHGVG